MIRHPSFLRPSSFLALPALALCTALAGPVPKGWEVNVGETRTAQFSAYRGETVEFEARLRNGARPFELPESATVSLHVSTNGVDYWSWPASATTGGVVRATWLPYYDCGADAYRCFIRVADGGSNVIYRANFLLRLLGSPGEWPAGLPPPVRLIDFGEVAATNAPWATPNDVSNIVDRTYVEGLGISGGGGINAETDPAFTEWLNTNGIAEAIANAAPGDYASVSNKAYSAIQTERDPVWESEKSRYATSSALADVARDASLIYQMMVGSNVVAEVTNYNSRARAPQLRLLQLDGTNGYITVWAETNGLSRAIGEANAHADAATNALARAKADRAWSRHTSALGADAPPDTTWISTPQTVIAGGYEYAKVLTSSGEAWVLASNGLASGGDTNAYFKVSTLDGDRLFGIEKTDDLLIGVAASDISVSGNVVTIPLDVVSSQPPVCYATDSLANPDWADLSDSANWPAWVSSASCTGSAGAWTWTINTSARSAFFQFRALQEGSTVIRHYAPTDLSLGLLINGTRYYPHAASGTLTWSTTP